ncbi:MAG TPA: C39 family peptidase, partial [Chroococcales cyanobacterium]
SAKPEYIAYDAMKAATFNKTDIQTVDVNGGAGTIDSPSVTPQMPVTDGPGLSPSNSSGTSPESTPLSQPFSQGDSGSNFSNDSGFAPSASSDSGSQNSGVGTDNSSSSADPNLQAYSQVLQDAGMQSISQPTLNSWISALAGIQFPLTAEEIALLEKEGLPANLVNALAKDPQLLKTLQSESFKSFALSPNFGTLGKIGDPNSYFASQIGGSPSNPNGDRNSNEDCGPTSIVMALRHFGKLSSDPQQAAQEIESVRNAMGIPSHTSGIGLSDIVRAANKYGLQASTVNSVQDIEKALAAGKQVVAVGNPIYYEQSGVYGGSTYDKKQQLTGSDYGNNAQYNGWHYIDVVGMTADGKFVVDDPLSRTGSFAITQSELQQYLSDGAVNGAGGNGVAIGP